MTSDVGIGKGGPGADRAGSPLPGYRPPTPSDDGAIPERRRYSRAPPTVRSKARSNCLEQRQHRNRGGADDGHRQRPRVTDYWRHWHP